jgi:hypothetical protein
LNSLRSRQAQNLDLGKLRVLGNEVRKSILKGDLDDAFVMSFRLAHKRNKGLRVIVDLIGDRTPRDQINPADMPYELIRFPEILSLNDFPTTGRNFTVMRTWGGIPLKPLSIDYPVRMLVVTASPVDQIGAKAEQSIAAVRKALKGLAFDEAGNPLRNGPVEVEFCTNATRDKLEKSLAIEKPWHIVHFVGHGALKGAEGKAASAQILLEMPNNHESDPTFRRWR